MPTVREEHPQVAHVVHFTDRLSDSDKVMLMGESLTRVYHKGASAAVAPVALSSWPIVIRAPVPNLVALALGTGQRMLVPPQGRELGVAGVSVAEVVEVGKDRPG